MANNIFTRFIKTLKGETNLRKVQKYAIKAFSEILWIFVPKAKISTIAYAPADAASWENVIIFKDVYESEIMKQCTPEEVSMMTMGLGLHEMYHLFYTDFAKSSSLVRCVANNLTDSEYPNLCAAQIDKSTKRKMLHNFCNIIEDAHIERRGNKNFPRFKFFIDYMNMIYRRTAMSLAEVDSQSRGSKISVYFWFVLQFAVHGKKLNFEGISDEMKYLCLNTRREILECVYENDSLERTKKALHLLDKVFPLLVDQPKDSQRSANVCNSMMENHKDSGSEKNPDQKAPEGLSKELNKKAPKKSRQNQSSEPESQEQDQSNEQDDEEQQSSKQQSEGSSESQDSEENSSTSESQKDDSEKQSSSPTSEGETPETSDENEGSKHGSEDEADSDETHEGESTEESMESDDDDEDDDYDDDEDDEDFDDDFGGASGSSYQDDGDDEVEDEAEDFDDDNGGSTGSSDQDEDEDKDFFDESAGGSNQDEEFDEFGDASGSSYQDEEFDEFEDESSDDFSQEENGSGADLSGGPDVEKSMENFVDALERAIKEEELQCETENDERIRLTNAVYNMDCETATELGKRVTRMYTSPRIMVPSKSSYPPALKSMIDNYVKKICRMVEDEVKTRTEGGCVRNQFNGDFARYRITDYVTKRGPDRFRLFDRNTQGDDGLDICVQLLIDESGSMSPQTENTIVIACIIHDICVKLGIPVRVATFDDDCKLLCDFDEKMKSSWESQIMAYSPMYGTDEASALVCLEKSLLARPETFKYLFLITDGAPGFSIPDMSPKTWLQQYQMAMIKKGVQFVACCTGSSAESVAKIYTGPKIIYNDYQKLARRLTNEFLRPIRS